MGLTVGLTVDFEAVFAGDLTVFGATLLAVFTAALLVGFAADGAFLTGALSWLFTATLGATLEPVLATVLPSALTLAFV
jgi:hypothetical protein